MDFERHAWSKCAHRVVVVLEFGCLDIDDFETAVVETRHLEPDGVHIPVGHLENGLLDVDVVEVLDEDVGRLDVDGGCVAHSLIGDAVLAIALTRVL